MGENELTALIYCLCVALKGVEPRVECVTKYVNCSFEGSSPTAMSRKEFEQKCADKVKGADLSCIGKINSHAN